MTTTNQVQEVESTIVIEKKKLELIPNEVVGFRIRPDQWNWSVVVVKVHGKDSKNAGQQYESPLPAYCKSIEHAVQVIFNRVAAIEGRKVQDETFQKTGICCDMESLKTAFLTAQDEAIWAVKDLEERLKEVGVDIKDAGKLLGNKITEEVSEKEELAE